MDIQEALRLFHLKDTFTLSELKKAYRRLAKAHHPDRFHGQAGKSEAEMVRVNTAYELLGTFLQLGITIPDAISKSPDTDYQNPESGYGETSTVSKSSFQFSYVFIALIVLSVLAKAFQCSAPIPAGVKKIEKGIIGNFDQRSLRISVSGSWFEHHWALEYIFKPDGKYSLIQGKGHYRNSYSLSDRQIFLYRAGLDGDTISYDLYSYYFINADTLVFTNKTEHLVLVRNKKYPPD